MRSTVHPRHTLPALGTVSHNNPTPRPPHLRIHCLRVLGNTITGISVGLGTIIEELSSGGWSWNRGCTLMGNGASTLTPDTPTHTHTAPCLSGCGVATCLCTPCSWRPAQGLRRSPRSCNGAWAKSGVCNERRTASRGPAMGGAPLPGLRPSTSRRTTSVSNPQPPTPAMRAPIRQAPTALRSCWPWARRVGRRRGSLWRARSSWP